MKTIEIQLFKFDELSSEAQKTAIENVQSDENYLSYEWYDSVYEWATTAGKLMGVDVDKIYFSGFSSQGDGACFEGDYQYVKGSVKAIETEFPTNKELQNIAFKLYTLQRKNFYQLTALVNHSGYYYHEMCTRINVGTKEDTYFSGDTEDELKDILRDFMRWLYSSLEREYNFLMSDENIKEHLLCNDYQFLENGEQY